MKQTSKTPCYYSDLNVAVTHHDMQQFSEKGGKDDCELESSEVNKASVKAFMRKGPEMHTFARAQGYTPRMCFGGSKDTCCFF